MAETTKIEIRNTSNEVISVIQYNSDDESTAIDKTSTSINLFGKGVEKYLTEVNENFYHLLENFASKTAPNSPQVGQLWYAKKGSNKVEVRGTGLNYNAGRYIKINGVSKGIRNRRGIALMIFDNSFASKIKFVGYYDTYGSNAARTQLARKLATVSDNEMFVMVSYDAIGTNSTLNQRMDRLGSQAWHKVKRSWRYPYAAIGTGKFGIISEDLQGFDDKKHAFAQVAFESLKVEDGMGTHTSLTSVNASNDNLLVWNGDEWTSSAQTLDGRNLKSLRSYVLSGVDLSVKFDKTGGTVNGSVVLANTLIPRMDITPTGNEIQDLGTTLQKYRSIHLSEDASIYMGPGKQFNKNSFVYTVEKEENSVTHVPPGSLILNRATGEAVVKRSNFVASSNNNTFRKLLQDKKYGVTIGGNNYNFNGNRGVWMGAWRHGHIQYVNIPTPMNSKRFGSCRHGGHSSGASDETRGLSFYQHLGHQRSYWNNHIQSITIATPMNATEFGRIQCGWGTSAASDGTRAVIMGGLWAHHDSQIQYVWFATPMKAAHFGWIGSNARWCGAVSDGSKAYFDRGWRGSHHDMFNNSYRYFSIATPGNAIYFGRFQQSRGFTGATGNGVHGLWVGGWQWRGTATHNTVEKLTLASPSNSSIFGTLMYSRFTPDPVSNESTMIAAGGNTGSRLMDTMKYASGGAATKFGDGYVYARYSGYFSGN